jgi:hypothetical protein
MGGNELQTIANIWPLILSVIFLISWLVRLESRVSHFHDLFLSGQSEIDKLKIKHDSLDSKFLEQLSEVRESLARIEGALGVRSRDLK